MFIGLDQQLQMQAMLKSRTGKNLINTNQISCKSLDQAKSYFKPIAPIAGHRYFAVLCGYIIGSNAGTDGLVLTYDDESITISTNNGGTLFPLNGLVIEDITTQGVISLANYKGFIEVITFEYA